jgi:hypothetical protein
MNHCQICGRPIKDKKGFIAHHGYKRPYGVGQTSSCLGARFLPYEESRDRIPYVIDRCTKWIEHLKQEIKNLETTNRSIMTQGAYPKEIDSTNPNYQYQKNWLIRTVKNDLSNAEFERERLSKRYMDWGKK